MSRVLVTGANGFVGRRLLLSLQEYDYKVRAALRRLDSFPKFVSNVEQVAVGTIGPDTNWQADLQNVDYVVHLAARVHVMTETSEDPLQEFRSVNVDGTINLALQAAAAGIKRFIYLSSIKVNGEMSKKGERFKAGDLPRPIDLYAISKYEAEQALLKVSSETTMEVVIIRPPLVYGPGVKANFHKMMQIIAKGIPLPFGAIHNKRSLVGIANLVDLIVTCIEHPAAANQTFLVSDGEDLSTTELIRRLGKALDKPVLLIPVPHRLLERCLELIGKGDVSQRICGSLQVDISKTKEALGWVPPVSVADALLETARTYLDENINK